MKSRQDILIQKKSKASVSPEVKNSGMDAEFLQGTSDIKDILRELVVCRVKNKYGM